MTIGYEQERQSSFKERVKQEREQEILQAARDVFSERGFEKASIDDIAERVGIGKGTVYLHFPSKEELLVALMRQACLHLLTICRAAAEQRSSVHDKLRCIVQTIADHRFANESWVSVVANELPAFIGHKQKLGASIELRSYVSAILEEGQASGEVDSRIKPAMAASTLLYLVYAAPFATGQPLSKAELVECACQFYLHGITKEAVK